jgi:KipI family sensor histidine kinase inhibitor
LNPSPELPAVEPYGDGAFLVELPDLAAVIAYYRGLVGAGATCRPEGVVDVVPAARTVLVTFDPDVLAPSDVLAWLSAAEPDHSAAESGRTVEIPVEYDGPDLAEVAGLLRTTEADVVRRHTGAHWTAAFAGFAPGFVYLVTEGGQLTVPRRSTPRTAVPAGAVGLAGEFSGVYPRSSPGGWQLIGTTTAVLWDSARPEPSLIRPGDTVRFKEA